MKTIRYREGVIIPKVGDRVLVDNGFFAGSSDGLKEKCFGVGKILRVERVSTGELTYSCDIEFPNGMRGVSSYWLHKVEEEEMKTKSYKDNNIIPKVGDKVVFAEKWFRECFGNDPQKRSKYDTYTIFIVTEVEEDGRLNNYVCKIEHNNIIELCNYHWLEKVIGEKSFEKEKKKKERKEFTTIEQDMMEALIGPE